jgi:hypothetical protein
MYYWALGAVASKGALSSCHSRAVYGHRAYLLRCRMYGVPPLPSGPLCGGGCSPPPTFADTFWTTKHQPGCPKGGDYNCTEANTEIQMIMAVLSGGPVGPGQSHCGGHDMCIYVVNCPRLRFPCMRARLPKMREAKHTSQLTHQPHVCRD